MPSQPSPRSAARLAALVTAGLVLLQGTAVAAVPVAPVRLPAAIEGFAAYQKQTTCSPTAKPGTTKLKNLLLKTYPGTRNLGIVRSCSAGGTSEHKEGRAFDWGVRVTSTSEAAKARAFLTWLLKADSAGRQAANARRLGVMYVIWNKRIWGAYAASSGWRPYSGSNPHTDHVHISLSRAGGAGTTSFWTGRVNGSGTAPAPAPAPAAQPRPAPTPRPTAQPLVPAPRPAKGPLPAGPQLEDERITVPPTKSGVVTRAALVTGQRYRVEVRGTWRWNKAAGSLADAECSLTAGSHWQPTRRLSALPGDQLGLYLDGRDLPLTSYRGSDCATLSHTYTTTITAARAGRVPLRLWEPSTAARYADNSGSLRVRLIHDVPRDVLPVRVDVRDRYGTTTAGSVVEGERYTVTVKGTWQPRPAVTADAACEGSGASATSPGRDGPDWSLVVGGRRLTADCREDHTYTWRFTAKRSGPAVVRIDEERYDDNRGTLDVVLTRGTATSEARSGPTSRDRR